MDADSVALMRSRYFSEMFAEKYHVPPSEVKAFFETKFRLCQKGEADLKKELGPYLREWSWNRSVGEFLQYWFSFDVKRNEGVLSLIGKLRDAGIKCYIVSNREKYRAAYIAKKAKLEECFDALFFSCELGHLKAEREFFEKVSAKINAPPRRDAGLG